MTDRLRLATPADAAAIDALMKASIAALFPSVYDDVVTASSIAHVSQVDRTLIDDGTYFVIEEDGDLVACGGWSRRAKLYTGSGSTDARLLDPATDAAPVRAMFTRGDRTRRGLGTRILQACEAAAREAGFSRLTLRATLPGRPLYERFGFVVRGQDDALLEDGVRLEAFAMDKAIG
jgi:GNAT superfamily N-acetyltransferase